MNAAVTAAAVALLLAFAGAAARADGTAAAGARDIEWRLSADGDWLAAIPKHRDGAPLLLAPVVPEVTGTAWTEPPIWLNVGAAEAGLTWQVDRFAGATGFGQGNAWCAGLGNALGCVDTAVSGGSVSVARPLWQVRALAVERNNQTGAASAPLQIGGIASPWPLITPQIETFGQPSRQRWLGASGGLKLAADLGLLWNAESGSATLLSPLAGGSGGFEVTQQSIGLGLAHGSFFGAVSGRVLRVDPRTGPRQGVTAFDVGIGWRAPWRGEFSFGAENLVVDEPTLKPALPPATTARTPFVRYRQSF